MLHARRKQRRQPVSLDITPLIDVVLTLIIFFMLTSSFIQSNTIHVRLPKAGSSEKSDQKVEALRVSIAADGTIYLDDQRTSLAELRQQLAAKITQQRDLTLMLRADTQTQHGTVVSVMDMAKQLGIQKLSIATEKVDSPEL